MDKLCKIRDLQRAVHQFESAFEKRYGICLNEGMTLCSLSKTGRLCPGELGELLGLTPSNTSKVLRSVEQKGLVTRELCNEDRRQMYYSLTQQGRLSFRGQPFVVSGRQERYSRKWFSSLKAAANSLNDLRWRRCIATAPSSSFSRTQRSSSRCSK